MPSPPPTPNASPDPPAVSAFKSKGGLRRVWQAATYSAAGLRAAVQHEAAFRQELLIGVPLLVLAPFIAPGRWQLLVMVASVVVVLIVELLNTAIEALADAMTIEPHPLLGRAKDLGSAAVMLSLMGVVFTWTLVLWP